MRGTTGRTSPAPTRDLRELRGQPEDAFGYRLGKLALRLDVVGRLRPATEAETSAVLAGFAVPALPEGVPVPVASFLATTGHTVSGMSEVTVLELPDTDRQADPALETRLDGVDVYALAASLTWTGERLYYLAACGVPPFDDRTALVNTLTHLWVSALYD